MEEPFFKTDEEYRVAVDALYAEWRNRPSHEAATDFDEWKMMEIVRLRGIIKRIAKEPLGSHEAVRIAREGGRDAD